MTIFKGVIKTLVIAASIVAWVLLCLVASSILRDAHADEVFANYGVGVFASAAGGHPASTKAFSLGYREEMYGPWNIQYKVGYWGDGSGSNGRKSSGYASVGPLFKADFSPVEIHTGWGLAAITTPDSYLGGMFPQFNGQVGLVLRDHRGAGIGIDYEHISSAGLVVPNQGRDFVTVSISESW